MSGSLRPSAGYIGRGVTAKSAELYMLYHQKSFAQVNAGSRCLRRVPDLLARHERVGLPPQPNLGEIAKVPAVADDAVLARQSPVVNVDCTEQVTAGVMVRSGAQRRSLAPALDRCGACVAEQLVRQPDDVENHGRAHAGASSGRRDGVCPRSTELPSKSCR